ncbi:MAG: flagellar hook-basal body complex protein [Albidovulum sp.]
MENSLYTTLNRQSGLMAEMRVIANNIANASTTGFRAEGVVFAEHVARLGPGVPSLSMANAEGRLVNDAQGALTQTGGAFDLAIEGDGYFLIETPGGNRLSRAGAFLASAEGELVTPDGMRLLDAGGAPVAVPAGAARIAIGGDGTVSADGAPVAQIGLWIPAGATGLVADGATRFDAPDGVEPMTGGKIFQGFLEQSNVNAVTEIARMIEVQRAYELGQGFLDNEDRRIRSVIEATGKG